MDHQRAQDVEGHHGEKWQKGSGTRRQNCEVQQQTSGSGSNSDEQTEIAENNHQYQKGEQERSGEKGNKESVAPDEGSGDGDEHGRNSKQKEKEKGMEEDAEKQWRRHISEVMIAAMLKGDMRTMADKWGAGLVIAEKIIQENITKANEHGKEPRTTTDTFGLDRCLKFTPRKAGATVGMSRESVGGENRI